MLLAIDCGNTNLVFAVYDGDEKIGQWRASTEWKRTADEYVVWLGRIMELHGRNLADIDDAIIASVVPSAMHALTTLCKRYLKTVPLVIGDPGVDIGVEVRIDNPMHVGADRLVNAVSAHETYRGPLIVIDFGTATTFDVIGHDGAYEGGIIAPGVNTSLEALHLAAAKLPRIAIDSPPQRVVGQDTISAMQSGAYWGYVGLLEGMVERIKAEQDRAMKVIATGGLAPLFANATDCIDTVDDDLLLRGLVLIHRLNRRARA